MICLIFFKVLSNLLRPILPMWFGLVVHVTCFLLCVRIFNESTTYRLDPARASLRLGRERRVSPSLIKSEAGVKLRSNARTGFFWLGDTFSGTIDSFYFIERCRSPRKQFLSPCIFSARRAGPCFQFSRCTRPRFRGITWT